jgi:glycerol uptake facilitator-like aquaporin
LEFASANTSATLAVLAMLIALFGPISGAQFNPVVLFIDGQFIEALRGNLSVRVAIGCAIVQIIGCMRNWCSGKVARGGHSIYSSRGSLGGVVAPADW